MGNNEWILSTEFNKLTSTDTMMIFGCCEHDSLCADPEHSFKERNCKFFK